MIHLVQSPQPPNPMATTTRALTELALSTNISNISKLLVPNPLKTLSTETRLNLFQFSCFKALYIPYIRDSVKKRAAAKPNSVATLRAQGVKASQTIQVMGYIHGTNQSCFKKGKPKHLDTRRSQQQHVHIRL